MNVKANISLLSQYKSMDSAYWGLGTSQDGSIFFALCSHQPGNSAAFFQYFPKEQKVQKLFSMDEHIQVADGSLPQGKVHTPIYEGPDGLLYSGTHFAYPYGNPQPVEYEGGHLASYNPKDHTVEDLGIPSAKEGLLTIIMDKQSKFIYMLTAPAFEFIAYDITKNKFHNVGRVTKEGSICRTLTLDDQGNVYGSYESNKIFKFNKEKFTLQYLKTTLPESKRAIEEWGGKSRGGVNNIGRNIWRSALWNDVTKSLYGIHSGTSNLFAFKPGTETITELAFMGADNDQDRLESIYPTLSLAQYKNTLFYVPASGFFDYARSEKIKDYSHLISYSIENNKKIDHGIIVDDQGRRVYGVAGSVMDTDGKYYLLGSVEVREDEEYNEQNKLQGKPFHLGLIEIDINKYI